MICSFDGRGRGREGGREGKSVTRWLGRLDEAKRVWKILNCEDMSNFSVVCLHLEVVSCLFFPFLGCG